LAELQTKFFRRSFFACIQFCLAGATGFPFFQRQIRGSFQSSEFKVFMHRAQCKCLEFLQKKGDGM
jgi:hypothetical protein